MFGNNSDKALDMLSNIQQTLGNLCATLDRHEQMLSSDSTYSLPNKIANHEGRLTAIETQSSHSKLSWDRIIIVLVAVMGIAFPTLDRLFIHPQAVERKDANGYIHTQASY